MKKMFIIGNVGRDTEMRADTQGNQYAIFSVAIQAGTKNEPKTDWVEVSCNNRLAEVANNYVKKGTKIFVEGYPQARAYINKENKAVATLTLYASNIELLSKKDDNDNYVKHSDNSPVYNLPENNTNTNVANSALSSDDIPF